MMYFSSGNNYMKDKMHSGGSGTEVITSNEEINKLLHAKQWITTMELYAKLYIGTGNRGNVAILQSLHQLSLRNSHTGMERTSHKILTIPVE